MKSILLTALFFPAFIYAQEEPFKMPVDSLTGKITYSSVVNVDTTKAATLFGRAKLFVTNNFNRAKAVNDLVDETNFTIVGKGKMDAFLNSMGYRSFGFVEFTFTIICKDDRYKYTITDFVHNNTPSGYCSVGGNLENEKPTCGNMSIPKKNWREIKLYADRDIKKVIETLKTEMQKNVQENW